MSYARVGDKLLHKTYSVSPLVALIVFCSQERPPSSETAKAITDAGIVQQSFDRGGSIHPKCNADTWKIEASRAHLMVDDMAAGDAEHRAVATNNHGLLHPNFTVKRVVSMSAPCPCR